MSQRLVGGAVAVLVLVASIVGVNPVHGPAAATGNVLGAGSAPRLAVGGGSASGDTDFGAGSTEQPTGGNASAVSAIGGTTAVLDATSAGSGSANGGAGAETTVAQPSADEAEILGPVDIEAFSDSPTTVARTTPQTVPDGITPDPDPVTTTNVDSTDQGPFLIDGTILKPIAVDTTAPDARTLLTKYKVRKGDTLSSVAHHFGLSLMTLYWANHITTNLQSKTDLKVGQVLSIPPVDGVLHIVTDKETLSDIAKRTKVSAAKIIDANNLEQPTVFVGEWILVPGARTKPIPEAAPKPVAKPASKPSSSSGSGSSSSSSSGSSSVSKPTPKPVTRPVYTGGGWVWPAPGGHISQYYHYGHWAIDIADTYGNSVLAAKGGTVIFAGWKSNGGGYQVWISHGNGVYTTYNHMSAITVGSGQQVGAGHQVGRIGQSGNATGPHLHFEVWIGPVWNGGTRVNPLNYV